MNFQSRIFKSIIRSVARFFSRRRKALLVWASTRALSDHQLADIGLSRSHSEFGLLTR